MDKKKRKRRSELDKKLAEALKPKKKTYSVGGSGASLTKRNKFDVEMGLQYKLRLRVPPVRRQIDMTDEEFKQALKEGRIERPKFVPIEEEIPMTKQEFRRLMVDKDFLTRRRRRTARDRKLAQLDYFETVEERWWIEQQMGILLHYDRLQFKMDRKLYDKWIKEYEDVVNKAIMVLIKDGEEELAAELNQHFEKLKILNKPKKPVLAGVVYKLRKLALVGDIVEEREYQRDLEVLFKALQQVEAEE